MRFELVKAYAFGPFRNQTLELAPGMNVVYGRNEAGKSSWHAALYTGLCGMRRGRGRAVKDDISFAARHRPWNNDTSWEVGAVIVLDDGRHVELRHDLAGRVDSSARDVDLAGRDYSNEIMSEGAPDGSRWLGLDRRSFVMTAFIRQANILRLLESPGELQDELQRASDTADRDGTAAEALARLREFRNEFVGSQRAPTKPLRSTENQVRRARRQLELAQVEHEEYLSGWVIVDELNQRAHELERRLGMLRAARAAADASEISERLKRAQELHSRFPGGAPRRLSQDDNIVRQVASALAAWSQRPTVRDPEGDTIQVLEAQLAQVNLSLAVKAERAAVELEKRLTRARELNALFPNGRPRRPSEDDHLVQCIASALTAWESRPDVHEPIGKTAAELKHDLERVESHLGEEGPYAAHETQSARDGLLATLLRTVRRIVASLFRLVGVGRRRSSMQPEERRALEEQRVLIRQQLELRKDADRQWQESTRRVREAADAVQDAAAAAGVECGNPDEVAASLLEWRLRHAEHLNETDARMKDWEELKQTLGEQTLDELVKKVASARQKAVSVAACTDSEELAVALANPASVTSWEEAREEHRVVLLHQIDERRRQEVQHAEAIASVTKAKKALAEAARLAGVAVEDPDEQVAGLRSWQDKRNTELRRADREAEEWEELQRALGQNSLEELTREVEDRSAEARALSEEVGVTDEADLGSPPTDDDLRSAEQGAKEARAAFIREESQLEAFTRNLTNVAEAEEELVAAKGEYARFQSLDRTLELTIGFLEQAEERVHRTIAPVLAGTVREWLPRVTGGRYTDCRVDPENLAAEVSTAHGHWQKAELLSHGTAEQVYLLLRLALARHLASESCPLVLDDALASSDSRRKLDLLETLFVLSESTQVISSHMRKMSVSGLEVGWRIDRTSSLN